MTRARSGAVRSCFHKLLWKLAVEGRPRARFAPSPNEEGQMKRCQNEWQRPNLEWLDARKAAGGESRDRRVEADQRLTQARARPDDQHTDGAARESTGTMGD